MNSIVLKGPDIGWLFLSRKGNQLPQPNASQWIRAHGKKVLGKRVHAHLFRHSIAVHLLRRGADIRHVQAFLAHADIDTTKVYLRMLPGHLKEDYDKAMPWLGV